MSSQEEFLTGGGVPAAFGKGDPVGKQVTGQVVSTEVRQQTDIKTGALLEWDNGDPRMQLVVVLQTGERDPLNAEDDGKRAVYVKGSKKQGTRSVHDAVSTAVRQAGVKGLEPGGTLTVRFVGTEPAQTRGFDDRKLWEATYTRPDAAAQTGDFLGTDAAPAAAPAAPAQQGGYNEAQLAALKNAGIDPAALQNA